MSRGGGGVPMSRPCILAVDLGTSGCKTALVDLDGAVTHWAFAPVETLYFPDGGAEQRPGDWWRAFVATARQVLAAAGHPEVRGICCSTQGEGTIAIDRDGNALMNAILWMDSRGAKNLESILGGPVRVAGFGPLKLWRWIRLTGGAPSLTGKDPASHMLYIRDAHPGVYARCDKFLTVPDYMNLRLTGRRVTSPDAVLTSWVTDNRDPDAVRYHPGLLAGCGIDADKFPEIIPCTEVVGTLTAASAEALGLPVETPVIAGGMDTTAAGIGAGAVHDFETHLYLGTSSWLVAPVPFKKTNILAALASVPGALPGKYQLIALQATAGGNLTFLRDRLLFPEDALATGAAPADFFARLNAAAAASPPGANGVLYGPWIYGERAPIEDRTIRAAFHNLSLDTTRGDMVRAVLEGVAFNTRWLLRPFEKFIGRRVEGIRVVGGGGQSALWRQILADVLDRPVLAVADPIQANVRGAAMIGAVGLGLAGFDEMAARIPITETHTPEAAHRDLYDERFARFTEAYRRTAPLYRRLNRG